jgi:thioesterase domain-containing protein
MDQPVYGLEPRIEYRSIEAMAADYVAAIRPVQKSGLYNVRRRPGKCHACCVMC